MNQKEYLDELEKRLRSLPREEREEILRDQREHFEIGNRAGRSDEEMIAAMGPPRTLAAEFVTQSALETSGTESTSQIQNSIHRTLAVFSAILILAPLNFFVLIGPFLVASSIWFAGWAASLGITFGGGAGLLAFFMAPERSDLVFSSQCALVLMLIALLSFGVGTSLLMVRVTQYYFKGLWAYAKWNVRFVQVRDESARAGQTTRSAKTI